MHKSNRPDSGRNNIYARIHGLASHVYHKPSTPDKTAAARDFVTAQTTAAVKNSASAQTAAAVNNSASAQTAAAVKNQRTGAADPYFLHLLQMRKDPRIRILGRFSQHQNTTTLDHVSHVAFMSRRIQSRLHLQVDEEALLKGAMLHDYYLYNASIKKERSAHHITSHPQTSLENARKVFNLNAKEENIIRSHMWPLTLRHIPKCKEAWLVCLADKICATYEFAGHPWERSIPSPA